MRIRRCRAPSETRRKKAKTWCPQRYEIARKQLWGGLTEGVAYRAVDRQTQERPSKCAGCAREDGYPLGPPGRGEGVAGCQRLVAFAGCPSIARIAGRGSRPPPSSSWNSARGATTLKGKLGRRTGGRLARGISQLACCTPFTGKSHRSSAHRDGAQPHGALVAEKRGWSGADSKGTTRRCSLGNFTRCPAQICDRIAPGNETSGKLSGKFCGPGMPGGGQ